MAERTKSAKGGKCKSSLISKLLIIWHFRLLARTAASQAAKGGIETPKCHHRKSKGSCTTDVRSADLKATSRRKRAAARS